MGKNRQKILAGIITLSVALFLTACDENRDTKQDTIQDGISISNIHVKTDSNNVKDLILVTIDPKKYELTLYEQTKENAKTIEEIQEETGSIISFNGAFFSEDFKPTGLLIDKGNKLSDFSKAYLMDGIFAIDKSGDVEFFDLNKAHEYEKYQSRENEFNFAIQNGPVLLDEDGKILLKKDTGMKASRTAIGLDKNGNIVLIMLQQSLLNIDNSISLYEFAQILKNSQEISNFQLHSVLNLDGGGSTGMMLGDKYYPEMDKVQNVVLVKKRQ